MQEKKTLSAHDVERLRREAKQLRKASDIPLWKAQDALAQRHGYANWSMLRREHSRALIVPGVRKIRKVPKPTAASLQRACTEFINSLTDDTVEGFCKGGASMWAPTREIQAGTFGEIEVLGSADDLYNRNYARQNHLLMLARFDGLDENFVFEGDDDYEEDENGDAIEPTRGQVFTPERGRDMLLGLNYGDSIDGVMEDLETYLNPPEH